MMLDGNDMLTDVFITDICLSSNNTEKQEWRKRRPMVMMVTNIHIKLWTVLTVYPNVVLGKVEVRLYSMSLRMVCVKNNHKKRVSHQTFLNVSYFNINR